MILTRGQGALDVNEGALDRVSRLVTEPWDLIWEFPQR
jgi:hypothetical protein